MAIPFDAEEIREALNAEIGDIIGKDAEAIVRAVVLATPVGNPSLWKGIPPPGYKPGRARGAWRINFGRVRRICSSSVSAPHSSGSGYGPSRTGRSGELPA